MASLLDAKLAGIQCPNPECPKPSKFKVVKTAHSTDGFTVRTKKCVSCNLSIETVEVFLRVIQPK